MSSSAQAPRSTLAIRAAAEYRDLRGGGENERRRSERRNAFQPGIRGRPREAGRRRGRGPLTSGATRQREFRWEGTHAGACRRELCVDCREIGKRGAGVGRNFSRARAQPARRMANPKPKYTKTQIPPSRTPKRHRLGIWVLNLRFGDFPSVALAPAVVLIFFRERGFVDVVAVALSARVHESIASCQRRRLREDVSHVILDVELRGICCCAGARYFSAWS